MSTKFTIHHTFDPKQFKVDYAKELNNEQLDVVQHGDGHVLVLAGAGSGKTRTIVYRVAYLLEKGIPANNILLVTFTNKAAKEMLFRVERLLGNFPKGLWGGTFHHVANLLLRKYAKSAGYEPNFTILDQEDSRDLIRVIVKELGVDPKQSRFPSPSVVQGLLSFSRNTGRPLGEVIEEGRTEYVKHLGTLQAINREYAERKKKNNQMDFDDMLVVLAKILEENEGVRERLATQFKYILVDEYQDTNVLQSTIVRHLASKHNNFLVVGDDAQSIYSFRGADLSNILNFPRQYKDAKKFTLDVNYRSTQPILNLANDVIRHNVEQYEKKLSHVREGRVLPALVPAANPEQEAAFVAQMMLTLRDEGLPLTKMAVLFRAAHQSQALEFELTRRDIPYVFRGGLRFFERGHIKDVIAYMKTLSNPKDEVAWHRVLNLQVGIGSQTAVAITARLTSEPNMPAAMAMIDFAPPKRAELGVRNLQSVYKKLLTNDYEKDPSSLVRTVMKSEYREYLVNQFPNFEERLEDLEQLAVFAERYDSLTKFLSEVSLQESFGVAGLKEGVGDEAVVLTTIHQAKGLEWDAVFVIHMIEGGFPNARALVEGGLEEERRLFYVAITRAMTHLFLTYPVASDMRTMNMRLFEPSQFLREVKPTLLEPYEVNEEHPQTHFFDDIDTVIRVE